MHANFMIGTEAVTENSLRVDLFHVRFLRGARRWSGVGGRCVTHGAPIKCARGAQGWQVCDFGRAESGRWQLDEAQPFCPLCAREFRCLPTAAGTVVLRWRPGMHGARVCILTSPRGVWAGDFGLTLRRHHCRKCGGVFCDSCTTLTKQGKAETRMCNGCKASHFVN